MFYLNLKNKNVRVGILNAKPDYSIFESQRLSYSSSMQLLQIIREIKLYKIIDL